jgi:hypothetical protein
MSERVLAILTEVFIVYSALSGKFWDSILK